MVCWYYLLNDPVYRTVSDNNDPCSVDGNRKICKQLWKWVWSNIVKLINWILKSSTQNLLEKYNTFLINFISLWKFWEPTEAEESTKNTRSTPSRLRSLLTLLLKVFPSFSTLILLPPPPSRKSLDTNSWFRSLSSTVSKFSSFSYSCRLLVFLVLWTS